MSALAPTVEAYFTERLIHQRQASPNTIAAYRDAWRLLLVFTQQRIGTEPCQLDLADVDAPLVAAFLEHLETERHNSVRTRNARPRSEIPSATPGRPRSPHEGGS
jgi:integrase/recombinase XerD